MKRQPTPAEREAAAARVAALKAAGDGPLIAARVELAETGDALLDALDRYVDALAGSCRRRVALRAFAAAYGTNGTDPNEAGSTSATLATEIEEGPFMARLHDRLARARATHRQTARQLAQLGQRPVNPARQRLVATVAEDLGEPDTALLRPALMGWGVGL